MTAEERPIMGNVLVIDDESDMLLLCRINLPNSGIAVSCAGSGQDGLQAAFDHTPDAVVLDLMMPQMDGFEVLRRLREDQRTRDVPVVVLTAKTSQDDRDQCYLLGADAFMTKPFDPDELTRELDSLMA
jgi:Response regulators consisting of a CheY-like receiver domain and a winged-helix DNA-binding domain